MLYRDTKIKDVEIKGNVFLAPLAGYTDMTFRHMCKKLGADFTYSEMVSLEGIARSNKKTEDIMLRGENEEQFAIQVFTPEAEVVERSIDKLLTYNPTIIDLNCGCPMTKVVKTGAGSALMKTPKKIGEIVKAISDKTDIPVTVKIRLGWDENSINYIDCAKIAIDNGASAIALHTRTRSQMYTGLARKEHLLILKEAIGDIPIIASGDLLSPEAVKETLEETHCDAVMLARGAIHNPWLFRETKSLLINGSYEETSLAYKLEMLEEHLIRSIEKRGERHACLIMRKYFIAAFKGVRNSSDIKKELSQCSTLEQYMKVLTTIK